MAMQTDPRTLNLLAALLSYPGPRLALDAAESAAALAATHAPAAERLRRFASFACAADAAEEAYTSAFDLAPLCSPYVGDQLFGASRERSLLLAGLREMQREAGLEPGPELPDHVAEVLRLVAAPIPGDVRDDIVRDGLAPAARKMLAALDEARHPWADVLAAVVEAVEVRAEEAAS
jgi:nitrate reductase molybdenum cofactor assembly chaperone NarJ/NarW